MEFKEKIKSLRQSKKLSRSQFAELMGVSIDTLHKYETGQRIPRKDQLIKISEALNISPLYFNDIQIASATDVFILMAQIYEQSELAIEAEKDSDGNIDPKTLKFSFKDKDVNEKLALYFSLHQQKDSLGKAKEKSVETNANRLFEYNDRLSEVYNLLAENGKTKKKQTNEILNRPDKPENVLEMESLLVDCTPSEIDYLIKTTKLFKSFNRNNK